MFICVIKHKTNVPENRIPDNGKILLYRLSRVIEKEKCPGGKRGVPGVPLSKLLLYINNLSMFLWCPYGVPMVSLRDTTSLILHKEIPL